MISVLRFFSFIIVFGIIVLVHEFGHFFAARLMKIRVEIFSFGFGKRIFGKKWGNTDFRLSMIPIGGFVRLGGDEDFNPENMKSDDLYSKNRGQRFFTFVMGSIMNIFLAVFLIAAINMTGVEIESYKLQKPVIGFVEKNSPAFRAGLQVGDLILSLKGNKVKNWRGVEIYVGTNPKEKIAVEFLRLGKVQRTVLEVSTLGEMDLGYSGFYWNQIAQVDEIVVGFPAYDSGLRKNDIIIAVDGIPISNYFFLREIIRESPNKKLALKVLRNKETVDLTMVPKKNPKGVGYVGFNFKFEITTTSFGFFESIKRSVKESGQLVLLTFNSFKKMVIGKMSPKNLSGPIEIARFSQQALSSGFSNFFMLIAFISLQLGIVNLFPIPGLDGGHLLILSVESIIRRDLNQKLKNILIYFGFSLLISLMLFVIFNDIAKALPNGWKSIFPFLK